MTETAKLDIHTSTKNLQLTILTGRHDLQALWSKQNNQALEGMPMLGEGTAGMLGMFYGMTP